MMTMTEKQRSYAESLAEDAGFNDLETAIVAVAANGERLPDGAAAAYVFRALNEGRDSAESLTVVEGSKLIGELKRLARKRRRDTGPPMTDNQQAFAEDLAVQAGFADLQAALDGLAVQGEQLHPGTHEAAVYRIVRDGRGSVDRMTVADGSRLIMALIKAQNARDRHDEAQL